MIDIDARIASFVPNAMSDLFDSGDTAVFDAIVVRVLAPAELENRDLRFYHQHPVPEDSPWRRQSGRLRFSIDSDLLQGRRQLFTGAARNLRAIDED